MSTQPEIHSAHADHRVPWVWFVVLGVICAILGIVGLGMTFTLTIINVLFYGILLIIAGGSQMVNGLIVRGWQNKVVNLVGGGLFLAAGILAVVNPALAGLVITLFLAIALICSGLTRIVLAFFQRQAIVWLSLFISGCITMLLGGYILALWPWDSMWVIGLFFAIDLIFQGISWITLGFHLRGTVASSGFSPGHFPSTKPI